MPKIANDLGVKYINNGSLVIAFNDEDMKTVHELYNRGIENGVENITVIGIEELKKLEPNISNNAVGALFAATSAIICPYELAVAAVGNAMDNGTELKCNFNVEKIEKTDNGYNIFSGNSYVEVKVVINCAGVFSDDIAKMVGNTSFCVTPRRGEYMVLDKECGDIVSHTIFRCPTKMGKGILITPTVDGNLLLGPTSLDNLYNDCYILG